MINTRSILFHVWSLLLFLTSLPCSAGELIPSWKQIEEELSINDKVLKIPFEDHWTNSVTLRHLVREHSTGPLLELASQRDLGLSSYCAYFALRRVDRSAAFHVGVNITLTANAATNLLASAVMKRLVEDLPDPAFKSALTRASMIGPVDSFNTGTFLIFLPYDMLLEWFEDKERPIALPTFEAEVVRRLYGEKRKIKEAPTTKMKDALADYALIPGAPRYIFAARADESDPNLKEALCFTLEDENIPFFELTGLLFGRASFISKNIDFGKLRLSEKRRSKIKDDLDQGLKFNDELILKK